MSNTRTLSKSTLVKRFVFRFSVVVRSLMYDTIQFFKASSFMRTWVEEEYGERTIQDAKTGKSELRQNYAIL